MRATRCNCGSITVEIDGVTESMRPLEFFQKFASVMPPRTERSCPACSPEPAREAAPEPASPSAETAPKVA